MKTKKKNSREMLTNEKIYSIMQWFPIVVTSVFFIINVTKKNTAAILVIGLCLAAFVGIVMITKKKKVSLYRREFIMSLALPTLVVMISLFSGESYSDDFPLYLAVIALCGMFLEPKFTFIQMIQSDFYLVVMYLIHPEKAGGRSQYILCVACFTLAAALFYQVIKRGQYFINRSDEKAKESEALLDSIRKMGVELQDDFEKSSAKIGVQTKGLRQESVSIAKGAGLASESCNAVQGKIGDTAAQIQQLNEGVKQFEIALKENRNNMETMNEQVDTVSGIISESGNVFRDMEGQMRQIVGIAKQISDISFQLTILSLNASVEAAHAGEYGAGFEVIAAEMRALSESSAGFSDKVSDVVKELIGKVDTAYNRVVGSEEAFAQSEKTMAELVGSFTKLSEQFKVLYDNIESQTKNISEIDYIFGDVNARVSDMHSSSLANQKAVEGIADAMTEFSGNVGKIVKNTQSI